MTITITNSSSIIGFENVGGGQWPVWDRYLTIDGNRAYHIGNICGTCAFFFNRLDGANQSVSATAIAERLNTGQATTDPEFFATLSTILPTGQYHVTTMHIVPHLITLGTDADYFVREQVDLWGIDSFYGLPHHPHIPYYRGRSIPLGEKRHLFEFIIPMFPANWLDHERVEHYQRAITVGVQPTAFVLSILDIKQPAVWDGEPAITEHWCLAHYLLDGHHKTYAAARTQTPLPVVSFLAMEESIARAADIDLLLATLAQ